MSDAPGISIPRKGKDFGTMDQDIPKGSLDSRASMDSGRGSFDAAADQLKQKDKWKLFARRTRMWDTATFTDPATSWYSA